jgi:hypothetical protein
MLKWAKVLSTLFGFSACLNNRQTHKPRLLRSGEVSSTDLKRLRADSIGRLTVILFSVQGDMANEPLSEVRSMKSQRRSTQPAI